MCSSLMYADVTHACTVYYTVICPVPEPFENVNISSYSSILEGSNATFLVH